MEDSIEREVMIKASVDRVWEVITTPEYINKWLWDFAEIDLRIGGAMKLAGTYVTLLPQAEPTNQVQRSQRMVSATGSRLTGPKLPIG